MAGAYLYHLVQNHPFIDGNKRVAMLVCLTFLDINDYDCTILEDEWIKFVMNIAQSEISKEQLTEFIRTHVAVR